MQRLFPIGDGLFNCEPVLAFWQHVKPCFECLKQIVVSALSLFWFALFTTAAIWPLAGQTFYIEVVCHDLIWHLTSE